jgi:hypothetical protein
MYIHVMGECQAHPWLGFQPAPMARQSRQREGAVIAPLGSFFWATGAISKNLRSAHLHGHARGIINSLVDRVFLIEVLFTVYGPARSRGGAL